MCYNFMEDYWDEFFSTEIVIVIVTGGSKEASLLVHLGHHGSVACPGLARGADTMESDCRGIFSHRG